MLQDNRNRDQKDDQKTTRDRSPRESRSDSSMPSDPNRGASRKEEDANVDDTAEMDDEDRDEDERGEGNQNRRRTIS